jgi:hypothetical protein
MYPLIWSKVVGVWLKSRQTKNIRKTDHLRDISAVVVSLWQSNVIAKATSPQKEASILRHA